MGRTNTIKISKDIDVWLCRHKQHERNNAWGLSYATFPFVKLGRGQWMVTFPHREACDVFEGIVHHQMKFSHYLLIQACIAIFFLLFFNYIFYTTTVYGDHGSYGDHDSKNTYKDNKGDKTLLK